MEIEMTLKKDWFDKIKSGEKTVEYRERKPYWEARLKNGITSILFRNGYGKDRPAIRVEVIGIKIINGKETDLKIDKEVFAIQLRYNRGDDGKRIV